MTVWSVRKIHDMKLVLLAYTKKDASMQLEKRIADGRLEGSIEDYLIRKEED